MLNFVIHKTGASATLDRKLFLKEQSSSSLNETEKQTPKPQKDKKEKVNRQESFDDSVTKVKKWLHRSPSNISGKQLRY